MKNLKAVLSAITLFVFMVMSGIALANRFNLQGGSLTALLGTILLLAALASTLLYLLMRVRSLVPGGGSKQKKSGGKPPEDDIDLAFRTARARLQKRREGAAKLKRLPVIVVVGPGGSTKTTVVAQSGLDAELLAGEVYRGETVVPTASVNLWYATDLVIAEAGGALVEDASRWSRLLRHLRPARWSAALMRRRQAPRVAVVCFPCDAFLQPGSSQGVPIAARTLRSRLTEMSQHLGIRLPVYVLFTKADQIPYFEDYVRSLTSAEAQQVLGATLPVVDVAAPGVYAEQQARRVGAAFGDLFRSLALHRLNVLPREAQSEVKAGAYEFPRELNKVSALATEFMVELCKPSQLDVSPFLRGFYFAGVRPVVVSDLVSESSPSRPAPGAQIPLGATSVFSLQSLQPQRPQAQPSTAGTRRVPEWAFLKRLFRDVVLQDRVAHRITGGGVRVDGLRRGLISTAVAALVLLCIGMVVSYRNNRALEREALAAAHGVERLSMSEFEAPSAEALLRLDDLREQTARLAEYERGRRPLRLRWGLYTGSAMFPHMRLLYFDRFERMLWANTRSGLLASLRALPDTPEEAREYGSIYDALKAHLITTNHPRESSAEFLTPVLTRHWTAGRGLDEERMAIAQRNFDFYAGELPHGNPYRAAQNEALVTQTRSYLYRFAGTDQFYQVLLAEAARASAPVRFHQTFPGSEAVVRNAYEVPAAFTQRGWAAAQATLDDVDRLFAREQWVVGERAVSPVERARLAAELRGRYESDYARHWMEYLRAGTVVTGGGIPEIARRLERLSGNQPPLMQMFALAAQHTGVDTLRLAEVFQPLHTVMPPGMSDRFVGEGNAGYIQALGGLYDALAQAATLSGPARSAAVGQASAQVDQVRGEIRSLSQGFAVEGPARDVGSQVQRLLQQPLSGIDGVIGALPAGEMNAKGAAFCQQLNPVLAKYPFRPTAGAQATVDDVLGAFQPGASLISTFYQDALGELLDRRGRQYGARIGADPPPSPAFVAFFNRAAAVSYAMFDDQGNGPQVAFSFRPHTTAEMPEITVSMDGQVRTFTRTEAAAQTFTWSAAHARGLRITARIGGVETPLLEGQGIWGVFQVFQQASWASAEGSRHTIQWRLPGQQQTLSADISFARGVPIFNPATLSFACVPRIAR
jgi:type VI secretion system protein ImpL